MLKIKIWDEKSSINGVSAETILANRPDLVAASGDIFLVVDNYDNVREIQIGAIIASNFQMEAGLSLQEIAEQYLIKREEEEEAAKLERLTVDELQEEVAILSYQVMVLQSYQDDIELYTKEQKSHSPKFKMIKKWFNRDFWNANMVKEVTKKGWLTEEEKEEIIKN